MDKYRQQENYSIVVAPYQDAKSKAIYPEAVYSLGAYAIDIEAKKIYWNIKVWASIDAFESGGSSVGLHKEYLLTDSTGLDFDTVMGTFPDLKNETSETLAQITQGIESGAYTKVSVTPIEEENE